MSYLKKFTKDYLDQEYIQNRRSLEDIANENCTYPNKVRRALVKFGIALRNKSEAQSAALESGRHKHPTKGIPRSQSTKDQIGRKVAQAWRELPLEEKFERITTARKNWSALTQEDKDNLHQLALTAIREAGRVGSKTERFLYDKLVEFNITADLHFAVPQTKFVVDLFLPTKNTIIQIDGPSHFLDIWGKDELDKRQILDQSENEELLRFGYRVIRVKLIQKNISKTYQLALFEEILKQLDKTKTGKVEIIEVTNG
jgi:very-short-patch-repair endonuclease